MITSKFNYFFTYNETSYVFNTRTSALLKLSKDLSKNLNTNSLNSFSNDTKVQLVNQGIILPKNTDEIYEVLMMDKKYRFNKYPSSIHLVIAPTMKCNLKCFYCFQNNSSNEPKMSFEVQTKIIQYIRYIIENNPNFKLLNIKWFGGEPLLRIDTIVSISKSLIKLCEENHISYHSSIITNGILLTKENQQILKDKCKVKRIQITLDGLETEYTKRKCASSSDYGTVIKNIINSSNDFEVGIRLNIDKDNINDMFKLTEYLLIDNKLKEKINIYIAPIIIDENFSGNVTLNYYKPFEFEHIRILYNNYLESINAYKSIKSRFRKRMITSCALNDEFSVCIDPLGDLYKCEQTIGIKKYRTGSLFSNKLYTKFEYDFRNVNISDKCKACILLPTCMGGCPFKHIYNKAICNNNKKIKLLESQLKYIIGKGGGYGGI